MPRACCTQGAVVAGQEARAGCLHGTVQGGADRYRGKAKSDSVSVALAFCSWPCDPRPLFRILTAPEAGRLTALWGLCCQVHGRIQTLPEPGPWLPTHLPRPPPSLSGPCLFLEEGKEFPYGSARGRKGGVSARASVQQTLGQARVPQRGVTGLGPMLQGRRGGSECVGASEW